MKTTTVGTCIVCNREIAVRQLGPQTSHPDAKGSTVLVHHGYQRPGDGAIRGDCFAVDLPPHELSANAAQDYQRHCETTLVALRKALVQHERNGVDVYNRMERVPVPTTAERPTSVFYGSVGRDPGWEETFVSYRRDESDERRRRVFADLQADAIVRTKHGIDWNEREIARMIVAIDTWALKPLGKRVETPPTTRRRRRRFG